MLKTYFAALLVLLLSGCASTELLIVSGFSYLVSGKSVSDHAISAAMEQDCAAYRMVLGDPICSDRPTNKPLPNSVDQVDGMIANQSSPTNQLLANELVQGESITPIESTVESTIEANTADAETESLARQQNDDAPVDTLSLLAQARQETQEPVLTLIRAKQKMDEQAAMMAFDPKPIRVVSDQDIANTTTLVSTQQAASFQVDNQQASQYQSQQRSFAGKQAVSVYAVVGSFNELSYAKIRAAQYQPFDTHIISAEETGSINYRVVVGPFADRSFDYDFNQMFSDIDGAPWALELCDDALAPPPCVSVSSTATVANRL